MNKFIHASIDDFAEQIKYLVKNYNMVSLDKIHQHFEGVKTCKENSVAIIIDDGFSNFYENIYPITKSYNIPIATAINCDRINNQQIPWDVMLSMLITLKGNNTKDDFDTLSKNFLNMNSNMRKKFKNQMKYKLNEHSVNPFEIDPDLRALTYKQIEKLNNDKNISFLSHGLSHDPINALETKIAKRELISSKKKIEELTSKRCDVFVYPQGKYDSNLVKLVKNAGYRYAYTVDHGFIYKQDNRLLLKRINIPPFSSFEEFICRLSGIGIVFSALFRIRRTLN
ncbi:MAG: polysaccharide deacetylase family protein [Candidatus Marinimicrobia bacterium]|nr:polysaccharide deacetylase family protein [Candidatus Neomarinimicrobiota bacterium]